MIGLRFQRWAGWHVGLWSIVVAVCLTALGYWAYTPDDGFIHLTFTRNLAETGTFAFSRGIPVNGSTSPLWNIVGALAVACGASPLIAIKVLGYGFTVATVALASWLMFRLGGPAAGWAVGWILCCDPWLMRWAVSGLETSMNVALILFALTLLYRGRPLAGCLVTGLLPLARPESALFLLLYAAAVIALHGRRQVIRSLPFLGLPSLIWVGYAYAQFGSVVQNSVRSKTLVYDEGVLERAIAMLKIAVVSHGLLLLVAGGLIAAFVAAWATSASRASWRPAAGWGAHERSVPVALKILLVVWPPLLVGGLLLSGSAVASRYYLPGTVVAYLLVAGWLAQQARPIRVGLPLASCLVSLGFSVFGVMPGIRDYSRNFSSATIEVTDALNRLARPGDVVAARDVGYLGYYNRVGYTILDMAGLVTPEMLKDDAARTAYVIAQRPRFIVDRAGFTDALAENRSLEQFDIPAFAEAGALRFETAALVGLPGLNAKDAEWYTVYSVDPVRLDRVRELAARLD